MSDVMFYKVRVNFKAFNPYVNQNVNFTYFILLFENYANQFFFKGDVVSKYLINMIEGHEIGLEGKIHINILMSSRVEMNVRLL